MTPFDEEWIHRMREAYVDRERGIPPEVFQALVRARNQALGQPAPRFSAIQTVLGPSGTRTRIPTSGGCRNLESAGQR